MVLGLIHPQHAPGDLVESGLSQQHLVLGPRHPQHAPGDLVVSGLNNSTHGPGSQSS